jgi:CO/xanthine dehydrogenase Mo-binding subunit
MSSYQFIGKSTGRIDAQGKVTGETLFPGDLVGDDMLHMKIRFAGRTHARVLRIDTTSAEAAPGVVAVFTARDVPVNEYGLGIPDQPVLCGPGSAKEEADVVRWEGDHVALVVAETEEQAAAACELIEIVWEDLPAVYDVAEALRPGAPQLHPDYPGNELVHWRIRRGDLAAGWAAAAVIVESEYHTPYQEHAYLQPEAGLARIDDQGRVAVHVAGQWTHKDRQEIAHALALPLDRVRVVYEAIGGAFGGREDVSVQIVLALAAHRLRRPVKIVWSRSESILGHHKRHPMTIRTRWGADRDGKLTAVEATILADAGAYAYTTPKVLGNANLMVTGPYYVPAAYVDTIGVYTNNPPGGAFRGFGGPQGAFAAECQMNKLAELLQLDPVEIRLRNLLTEDTPLTTGRPLPPGVTITQVVERCAEEAGWRRQDGAWHKPAPGAAGPPTSRGIGFACAFKNVGFSFGYPENSWARIELYGGPEIERAVLFYAGAECGQGAHSAIVQMAAEALEVPPGRVELRPSDTATSGDSGSASASRMTFMAGNAIRGAAEKALAAWADEERPAAGEHVYHAPPTTPYDPQTGASDPNFAYGYVAEAAEVAVDRETGQVHVLRVVCVDDVGQAINPQQVEGQIEGAIVQAQGYALLENLVVEEGRVQNPYLSTYLIPTVLDVPDEIRPVILELADPRGPFGARGMGEMPFMPLAPAVVAALHDATGIWFDAFPLTPDRVWRRLREDGISD